MGIADAQGRVKCPRCEGVFETTWDFLVHKPTCLGFRKGLVIPPALQVQSKLHRGILLANSALRGRDVRTVCLWFPGGRGTLSTEMLFELSGYYRKGWIKIIEAQDGYDVEDGNPLDLLGMHYPDGSVVSVRVEGRKVKAAERLYVDGPDVLILYRVKGKVLCWEPMYNPIPLPNSYRVNYRNGNVVLEQFNGMKDVYEPLTDDRDLWVCAPDWDRFIPAAEKRIKMTIIFSKIMEKEKGWGR